MGVEVVTLICAGQYGSPRESRWPIRLLLIHRTAEKYPHVSQLLTEIQQER